MPAAHYFDADPAVASRRQTVTLRLADLSVDLTTDRGVFSRQGIDPGTELLLSTMPPPPTHGEIVDLGCGYGAIALAVARRSPGSRVWAVDVNRRALELVRLNAEAAGVTNVVAARPEEVPTALRLDAVYSNPPVRVGKAALHDLLVTWLDRLAGRGQALLVVHRHLGSDSLARWLEERGHRVERLRSRRGYRILSVSPSSALPPLQAGMIAPHGHE